MTNEKKFVAIPNRVFAFESNSFLTNDEIEVFYQLCVNATARNPRLAKVNVALLNDIIEFDISNSSRSKKRVRDALLCLQEKGYIKMAFSDSGLKNTTYLEVSLPAPTDQLYKEKVKSGSWTYMGFTKVTDEMYERAETIDQLKVLIYVDWRSFSQAEEEVKYAISYKEWEAVLGVSHATAVNIIKDCEREGLIYVKHGQYYTTLDGQVRQETNEYSIKEPSERKPVDLAKQLELSSHFESLRQKSSERRKHNWFDIDAYINEDDMYIFLTTSCSVLKESAERRSGNIRQSGKGQSLDDALAKAQNRIEREEKDRRLQQQRDEEELAKMEERLDREHVYGNRNHQVNDMSFLFEAEDQKRNDDDLPFL